MAVVATAVCLGAATAGAATDPGLATAAPVQPRILLWGTGAFVGRDAFEGWLRRHHERWASWAATHPAALAVLTRSTVPLGFRPSQLATTPRPRKPQAFAPPVSVPAPHRRFGLDVLLLLLGAALAAAAVTLPMRDTSGSAVVYAFAERRLAIFTAGTAILIGVAIAKVLG
jgi:ferric-dicitrate binding protein FerR (iron transport regulator)